MEKVKEVQSNVKSKRLRRKIVAVFFGNANADKLKGCCEDLDWAMKKFDVSNPSKVGRASLSHSLVLGKGSLGRRCSPL